LKGTRIQNRHFLDTLKGQFYLVVRTSRRRLAHRNIKFITGFSFFAAFLCFLNKLLPEKGFGYLFRGFILVALLRNLSRQNKNIFLPLAACSDAKPLPVQTF